MSQLISRDLGCKPLPEVWKAMKRFTDERGAQTPDELWFVEHPPIYTLGLNADRSHVLDPREIPVVKVDRGGQVTYHGPGQLVTYLMLDLERSRMSVRQVIELLEGAVVDAVAGYGIEAFGRRDAPGVYVGGRKLAAVGLRIRRHCSYHGVAVNVDMDLEPFRGINPCGFEALEVTQLSELCGVTDIATVRADLESALYERLPERLAAKRAPG